MQCMKKPFRVWDKGVTIRSPRVIEAFDRGILVKMKKYGGNNHYYAKCEHPGCSGSYNLTMTREAGFRRKRCGKHSRLVMVAGHTTNVVILAEYASRVVWMPHKYRKTGGLVPYIRCAARGCNSLSIFKPSVTIYHCTEHGSTHKRLRPYEALYRSWLVVQARRNKNRSKPLNNSLTFLQFARICKTQAACHYCKTVVQRPMHNVTRSGQKFYSTYLDRVDATKGYSASNVVTCCASCNFSKNNFISYEEMLVLGALRTGDSSRLTAIIQAHQSQFVDWQQLVSVFGIYNSFGRTPGKDVSAAVRAYFSKQRARRQKSTKK